MILWVGFIAFVSCLLIFDLFVFHRKNEEVTFQESLIWTLIWIVVALGFNVFIYFLYEYNPFNLIGYSDLYVSDGASAALQFFAGYVLEKTLSLDNIFVIALIFAYFKIPLKFQHRLLFWGVLSAIVFRALFISAGIVLIHHAEWMLIVFGVLLLVAAIKMMVARHDNLEPEKNIVVRLLKSRILITDNLFDDKLLIKVGSSLALTPLMLALIMIETADITFAVGSIPAIYSVTQDPFIAFTSNIFAVMGLRSLYFVMAYSIPRLRYLKQSLVYILIFIGLKMMVSQLYDVPTLITLFFVLGILGVGILASLWSDHDTGRLVSPIKEDLIQLSTVSYKHLKKTVIGLVGLTVLIIGFAMIVLPGPAILVIPLGLSILSLEFIWARKWLNKYKDGLAYIKNKFTKDKG